MSSQERRRIATRDGLVETENKRFGGPTRMMWHFHKATGVIVSIRHTELTLGEFANPSQAAPAL